MRVMVIVKATKESEAEDNPFDVEGAAEMFEAMGKFNEELVKAGIMLAGDGLKPSKFGKRVHFNGTKRSVTDGPFAETKELVAGFWIWQVRSMDEAIEWAKRCPNPMPGEPSWRRGYGRSEWQWRCSRALYLTHWKWWRSGDCRPSPLAPS